MSKAVWFLSSAFGAAAMISVDPAMAADLDPSVKVIQGIDEVRIQECQGSPD